MHGFEDIAKRFGDLRLSRRSAVAQGVGGLAGGAAALAGLRAVTAQDAEATPVPATGDKTTYLFVQSFQSGSIAPSEGEFGTHTVTLEQGWGQTIYFGDRPSRDVGANSTVDFLNGLGFDSDNPPNAALVVETGSGESDVAVVELFNPTYDESTHTATYEVELLANWRSTAGSLQEEPLDLDEVASYFGTAHLLIDDCADRQVQCLEKDLYNKGSLPLTGFCYRWDYARCIPCEPDFHDTSHGISNTYKHWSAICDQTIAECNGNCTAEW